MTVTFIVNCIGKDHHMHLLIYLKSVADWEKGSFGIGRSKVNYGMH